MLYVVLDSEANKFAGSQRYNIDTTAALLDENAVLHGIYAFPNRARNHNRWPVEYWHTMPARKYLQIIHERETL